MGRFFRSIGMPAAGSGHAEGAAPGDYFCVVGTGAGEGNRTLVFSLEGCCSTIELHPRATDQLSRQGGGLNRHATGPLKRPLFPTCFVLIGPLTGGDSLPILKIPSTTKGGDPVSYTKLCHLAGIAR